MRVVEDKDFCKDILNKIETREFSERTGVHCSDLLYCLNKQAIRRLHPVPSEPHEILLFSLGWSTQRWLTGQDKDEEEKVVDGITVTCDAKHGLAPWELKATFQSSNKDILENIAWFRQMMAQCYVTNTTIAYLTRLEIMGNWKSIFGKKDEKGLPENEKPTLHAYRIEFTKDEIAQNWEWLKERRDQFQRLLDGSPMLPKLLSLAPGMAWLCEFCNTKCTVTNDT